MVLPKYRRSNSLLIGGAYCRKIPSDSTKTIGAERIPSEVSRQCYPYNPNTEQIKPKEKKSASGKILFKIVSSKFTHVYGNMYFKINDLK